MLEYISELHYNYKLRNKCPEIFALIKATGGGGTVIMGHA
ncbi:hypothetical protein CLOBOL_00686 [Enterocloster bolteae ATCC BAA-613]|uniref:Uncharacterized protein n=1 Tax=Enterocloster bolteae (strain ATCC BAA-613 / DSM 15670 / CCUG 46953 / JCM 12243 / WAL 16351) TaxID=411902 RepID=A8RIG3_ENTBW|nr:hypothetical protein CLOBOL_00686 [Enterocloster bolteae ATCC BAA-613]